MIGSFGNITFLVPLAPEQVSHSKSAEFAEHDVLGAKPVTERTGDASDEVSFTIRLRRRWMDQTVDVKQALEDLRAKVEEDPERLLLGEENLGTYVLEEVNTTYTDVHSGRIWKADVELSFREYN